MDVRVGLWRRLSAEELMLLNCGVGEDSWESLGRQGDPTSPFWRRSTLGFLWREWCWSWNPSTLATLCEELTHLKGPWCWEGLGAGGEGDDRGWDGWMASLYQWMWVWVNSGSWWWTGRPGVQWFMGSQIVGHDWATELNCHITEFWLRPQETFVLILAGPLTWIILSQWTFSVTYTNGVNLRNYVKVFIGMTQTVVKVLNNPWSRLPVNSPSFYCRDAWTFVFHCHCQMPYKDALSCFS